MPEQQGAFNIELHRPLKQCNLAFKWSILKNLHEPGFGLQILRTKLHSGATCH